MARNEEKAQAMLNRWWRQKQDLHQQDKTAIPRGKKFIFKVESINECEKFRNSLLRDISKKVSKIQNAGQGEKAIRDLNDEINRLLGEVRLFEERIHSLGGANYKRTNPLDADGQELPGFGGYKYFGAAKDLPGVRELFQKEVPEAPQKSLVDVYRDIDFELYFGRKIQSLEEMLQEEKEYEEKLREDELWAWATARSELISVKLKGKQNPTREEIFQLLEEETYADIEEEKIKDQSEKDYEEREAQRIRELNEKKKQLLDAYLVGAMEQE